MHAVAFLEAIPSKFVTRGPFGQARGKRADQESSKRTQYLTVVVGEVVAKKGPFGRIKDRTRICSQCPERRPWQLFRQPMQRSLELHLRLERLYRHEFGMCQEEPEQSEDLPACKVCRARPAANH